MKIVIVGPFWPIGYLIEDYDCPIDNKRYDLIVIRRQKHVNWGGLGRDLELLHCSVILEK